MRDRASWARAPRAPRAFLGRLWDRVQGLDAAGGPVLALPPSLTAGGGVEERVPPLRLAQAGVLNPLSLSLIPLSEPTRPY